MVKCGVGESTPRKCFKKLKNQEQQKFFQRDKALSFGIIRNYLQKFSKISNIF